MLANLEFVSEPGRICVYYECTANANASTCSQECSEASCSGTIPGRRRALSEDSRKQVAGATSKFVGVCACVCVCVFAMLWAGVSFWLLFCVL